MRIIKTFIFLLLHIPFYSYGMNVIIDGNMNEWTSLKKTNIKAFSQIYNDSEYIYISYLNESDTTFIPIHSSESLFFIPKSKVHSYLSFGKSIINNSNNNHTSSSNLEITLINGTPRFKYLTPINSSYKSLVKYKTKKVNNLYFTEIAIPKRLFGKSTLSQNVTLVNVYSGLIKNKISYSRNIMPRSSIQQFSQSNNGSTTISDFSDVTITVGISASGLGTNFAAGLAADDKGLGGYFDKTAGDADLGISIDIGVFQGDVTDLNGETFGGSAPIKGAGIKFERPLSGSPFGQGFTVSLGYKGGYSQIPDLQITSGSAAYFVTDESAMKAIDRAFGTKFSTNYSGPSNNDNHSRKGGENKHDHDSGLDNGPDAIEKDLKTGKVTEINFP
ncbi:hypothetical protein [Photobacterium sp. R1]